MKLLSNLLNSNILFYPDNGCGGGKSVELDFAHKSMNDNCYAFIGKPAPVFKMKALMPDGSFGTVSLEENTSANKWTVLYFYPADFTFVCPTEIKALSDLHNKFEEVNAKVIACSVDSVFVHEAWIESSLKRVNHPMASDQNHFVSKAYGVYDEIEGLAWRGLFIIDPEGILWGQYNTYKTAGRSAKEVLRLLKACQFSAEGKFVPCDWSEGDSFIKI